MEGPESSLTGAEERLAQVLDGYLAAIDRGESPDRAAIIGSHPDLADELREFFGNHDRFSPQATELATGSAPPPLPADRVLGDYLVLEEV
ncbi:MAG: hypothetical protein ACRDHY_02055, partial [Anaerolineales bacterium]